MCFGLAAGLSAYELHQDGTLRTVLKREGFDMAIASVVGMGLYFFLWLSWTRLIAPVGVDQGGLAKCTVWGVRAARPGADSGLLVVTEALRAWSCKGYAQSLGLVGAPRGVAVVLVAVAEEFAWRGGVQQGLSERFGSTRGWVLSSVLYAALQLGTGNPAIVLMALPCGFAWGAL